MARGCCMSSCSLYVCASVRVSLLCTAIIVVSWWTTVLWRACEYFLNVSSGLDLLYPRRILI